MRRQNVTNARYLYSVNELNSTFKVEEFPPILSHKTPLVVDTCHLKFLANAVSVGALGGAAFNNKLSFPPTPLQNF